MEESQLQLTAGQSVGLKKAQRGLQLWLLKSVLLLKGL